METIQKKEILSGHATMDLMTLKNWANQVASDWNGEDPTFMSGGDIWSEEHAQIANEITEKCDELIDLLLEFNQ